MLCTFMSINREKCQIQSVNNLSCSVLSLMSILNMLPYIHLEVQFRSSPVVSFSIVSDGVTGF